jgi:hypothetical protein
VKKGTPEQHPTFWDKHGANILLMFALGALIWGYLHWLTDGEATEWVFATLRNIWEYEKKPPTDFFLIALAYSAIVQLVRRHDLRRP